MVFINILDNRKKSRFLFADDEEVDINDQFLIDLIFSFLKIKFTFLLFIIFLVKKYLKKTLRNKNKVLDKGA
jgi:hypothetical protein